MRSLSSFGFPPFTRAIKQLVWVNVVIFLLWYFLPKSVESVIFVYFGLVPAEVMHGMVWQIVTYSFIHAGILHILFNMLGLWMFGSKLEMDWGYRQLMEFYFFCVVGAALITMAVSYTGVLGMSPATATVGASGGIYGLIVAFGIIYAEMRIYVYGIFPIKAKWFAIIWVGLALLGAMQDRGGVANVAHLGGAIFGYAYLKLAPRRGLRFAFSEGYYGVINRYHRWRRKQAAKKFEVYMRQHDRNKYFDEYGNYREKDEPKGGGNGESRGGWIN